MEVWGGAVPTLCDALPRRIALAARLRTFSEAMDSKSDHPTALLRPLSRPQPLRLRTLSRFGTRRFYKEAIANGLNVMRYSMHSMTSTTSRNQSRPHQSTRRHSRWSRMLRTVDPKPEAPAKPEGFSASSGAIFGCVKARLDLH